ncbi:hypothetical protein D7X33_08510 [Butyricicoccus sp. 1XD8-22]|nr:hypothetical protein D7X33_08510 [Butyricicoccus sp. 1XD8-22]
MERLREVRSTPFSSEAVFDELSRLESMVSEEVHGCGAVLLAPGRDDEKRLLAAPPYDGMYLHYLCAKLDMMMQEYDSANTEMTVFTGLYQEYAKWHRRTHRPKRGAQVNHYV